MSIKKIFLLIFIGVSNPILYGQVGINTSSPKVTLDIAGDPTNTSVLDGVLIPRLSGDELKAKTYNSDTSGTLIYVTSTPTLTSGQVSNISTTGLHYFDGSLWQPLKNSSSNGAITTITNSLSNNNENIITSSVNGVTDTTTAVTSVKNILVDETRLLTIVNGVSSSPITLPSSNSSTNTNIYNSNGTLSGNRTVTMNNYNLLFNGTGKVGLGTTTNPSYTLDVGGNAYISGVTTLGSGLNVIGTTILTSILEYNLITDKVITISTAGVLKKVDPKIFYNTIDQTINFSSTNNSNVLSATGDEDIIWMAGSSGNLQLSVPTDAQIRRGRRTTIIAAGGPVTIQSGTYNGQTNYYNPTFTNGIKMASLKLGERITIVPVNIFGGYGWYVLESNFNNITN